MCDCNQEAEQLHADCHAKAESYAHITEPSNLQTCYTVLEYFSRRMEIKHKSTGR